MSKAFYEKYWQNQDVLDDFDYKWPIIQTLLPPDSKKRLLDFGCGTGVILKEVSAIRPNFMPYGVDIADKALYGARKRIPKGRFHLITETQKIPFSDSFFDIVLALDVLEHIYDTQTAFRELSRVLKPNGTLVITVPYNGTLKLILAAIIDFDFYFDPYSPHIRFFKESSIKKCLNDAGLKDQKVGYFGRFFPLSNGMYILAEKS